MSPQGLGDANVSPVRSSLHAPRPSGVNSRSVSIALLEMRLFWAMAIVVSAMTPALAAAVSPLAPVSAQARVVQHPSALTLETSVAPLPDEDLAGPCKYEMTLVDRSRRIKGIWVIFERSRDTRSFYVDANVRAFARRHDVALLFPFHCPSKSDAGGETPGDINVDPSGGLGRALFAAIAQLSTSAGHSELTSAKLILLGFSGTGSLVARLAEYAADRVLAVIPTGPGHRDAVGMDTIVLSAKAAAIPQLVLVGSADAVSGTARPYAYFQRHFDQGAPWTFVVQNLAPHCCIMNAKALILEWLEAVVGQRLTRSTGYFGFIRTTPTTATDCPDQTDPVRRSWCRSPADHWGGPTWSVASATIDRRPRAQAGMLAAGWLPTRAFADHWRTFVTRSEYPVTLPP